MAAVVRFRRRQRRQRGFVVPRVIADRQNPFEAYGDEAFRRRYRLRKETVLAVAGMMPNMMPDPRGPFVPVLLQLCSFLLWAANGCFFRMVADVVGVHRAHMSRVVRRISRALVALAPKVIRGIPRGGAAHATRQAFWDLAGNYYSFTLMCGRRYFFRFRTQVLMKIYAQSCWQSINARRTLNNYYLQRCIYIWLPTYITLMIMHVFIGKDILSLARSKLFSQIYANLNC